MDVEEIRAYCLSKKGTDESFPFDDTTLVIKLGGKIFILINLYGDLQINLKCEPSRANELRESYPAITPGYHMSKKHWNTVVPDGSLPQGLIKDMIDHSYDLVFQSLTGMLRLQIEQIKF